MLQTCEVLHTQQGSTSATTGNGTEVVYSGSNTTRRHTVRSDDGFVRLAAQEEKEERRRKREAIVAPDVFSADGKGGRIVLYTQVLLVRCFSGPAREHQALAMCPCFSRHCSSSGHTDVTLNLCLACGSACVD